MMGLEDIPAHLSGLPLLAVLAAMGVVGGAVSAMFGVGGSIIITPLLNAALGVPYSLAVGSSLGFTLGTSAGGWARHWRMGNVALRTMLALAAGAVCGSFLGERAHHWVRGGVGSERFTLVMHGLFIAVLIAVAYSVGRRPGEPSRARAVLERLPLPPRVRLDGQPGRVSLPGVMAGGLAAGVLSGLMGIGGGILLVPVMVLLIGLGMHRAVGTSLGVIVLTSVAGVVLYGLKGEASLWIIMPLLVGSSVGVQLGAWLCHRLPAATLRRYFAVLAMVIALYLAVDFVRTWNRLD
jgi:uncharacterized membrane protein YfcA